MTNAQKPVIRLPGDAIPQDGRPYINAGTALILAVLAFIIASALALLILWNNFPFIPLPPSDRPALFHVYNYYAHWVGVFFHLQFSSFKQYDFWIYELSQQELSHWLGFRWFLATCGGLAGGYFAFKKSWVPILSERQVRGRVLLEGQAAFTDLKKVFDHTIKNTKRPGLILASDKGYNPTDPKTFEGGAKVIRYPDDQRRTHYTILGGSRRGKGVFNKQHVIQIYNHIRKGDLFKIFIIDTPKGEYAQLIDKRHMIQIAPDEKFSVAHAIAKDLILVQDAQQFWKGRIPENEKDPFWSTASRGVGAGLTAFLQREAGTDWSYNNLAYWKDQAPEIIEKILNKYYPEINQVMNMGTQSLGSVMGTMAGFTMDLNDLARIWDGYDYKQDIHQMSVALLKKKFWLKWFLQIRYPTLIDLPEIKKDQDGNEVENQEKLVATEIPTNQCTHFLLYGLISHFNKQGDWKWTDLKDMLQQPWQVQTNIAKQYLQDTEFNTIDESYIKYHLENIQSILENAEIWDEFEATEKVSIREWVLDESPKKKVFFIKPSGRFNEQTQGLVRGLLYFMTGIINDKYYTDDKTDILPVRNFHIFCDEFQSLGNLKGFIGPALEMFASRGITVYLSCQDLSQLKEIYGENFLNFLQANTGNVFIMGTNQGASADMISNLIGKKTILKMHISRTQQADGSSSSISYQEHEGIGLTPDEVNSKLGTDLSMKFPVVRYLYMPGNLPNAYILSATLNGYKKRYKSEPADWMTGQRREPAKVNGKEVAKLILGKAKETEDTEESAKEPMQTLQPSNPVANPDLYGFATMEEFERAVRGEEDLPVEDMPLEDLADELDPYLEEATKRVETQRIYTMPKEEESMAGSLVKDVVIESVLNSHVLHGLKSMSEVKTNSSTERTNNKKKFLTAILEKKEKDLGLDRETKH